MTKSHEGKPCTCGIGPWDPFAKKYNGNGGWQMSDLWWNRFWAPRIPARIYKQIKDKNKMTKKIRARNN